MHLDIFVDPLAGIFVSLVDAFETYRLAEAHIQARRKLGNYCRWHKLLLCVTTCRQQAQEVWRADKA